MQKQVNLAVAARVNVRKIFLNFLFRPFSKRYTTSCVSLVVCTTTHRAHKVVDGVLNSSKKLSHHGGLSEFPTSFRHEGRIQHAHKEPSH